MQNENTSVVISGLFEQEKGFKLLEGVRRSIDLIAAEFEIIIVENNSGDWWKTYSNVPEMSAVRTVKSPKDTGLAQATLHGINAAKHGFVVVISCDAAPEKIPELISLLQNGVDVAIASPCPSSEGSDTANTFERVILAGADFFTRTLFRKLRNVSDAGSGFFALRKTVVTRADLRPAGDNLLLEILIQGECNSISELVDEGERNAELMKARRKRTGTMRHISSLFWRSGEFHRFLQFCAVGAVGAVVNLAVLFGFTALGVFYVISGLLGIEAGLLSNFFLNRSWTFKDRQGQGLNSMLTALYRDHAVRFVGIVLNLAVLWILTSFFGLYYLLSQLIGIGVAMLWNYGGNQWWTWEAREIQR